MAVRRGDRLAPLGSASGAAAPDVGGDTMGLLLVSVKRLASTLSTWDHASRSVTSETGYRGRSLTGIIVLLLHQS